MSLPRSVAFVLVALSSLLAGVRDIAVAELRASQGCEMSCCAPSEPSCCVAQEDGPRVSSGCGCCDDPSGMHVVSVGLDWAPVTADAVAEQPIARQSAAQTQRTPRSRRPAPRPKPPRA